MELDSKLLKENFDKFNELKIYEVERQVEANFSRYNAMKLRCMMAVMQQLDR